MQPLIKNTAIATIFAIVVGWLMMTVANANANAFEWTEFTRITYSVIVGGTAFTTALLTYLHPKD